MKIMVQPTDRNGDPVLWEVPVPSNGSPVSWYYGSTDGAIPAPDVGAFASLAKPDLPTVFVAGCIVRFDGRIERADYVPMAITGGDTLKLEVSVA